jgi:4-amino-4-deoxy-L-arabinose transferase-like glycosyltransferase
MRAHLNDAAWFQYGSYSVFDKRANDILNRGRLFWIDDPSRTDLVQYPPAYPWMVAAIYGVTGERSVYAVQNVQTLVDLFVSFLLVTGIATTVYGWHTGLTAAFFTALSPLLAMVGVSPSADAPTGWFVGAALWLLLVAAKRNSLRWAIGAGMVLGMGCWFRVNPLYLCAFWTVVLLFAVCAAWRRRLLLSSTLMLTTLAVISPIMIRNYIVFPQFTTGGTIGANLWEGLGETERGRSAGFLFGDSLMVERERARMGLPANAPFEAMWPDESARVPASHSSSSNNIRFGTPA